jgi:pentatricopeptide repeat domain-containing protein 1
MIAAGVSPTATTFTGLITAYGKTGRIDQAMEVYRDMSMRGCERNVITYSSLISAAEKAGRLDIALELLKTMQKEGIRPNTITYNSLLAACCHGGNWEMAQHLFDQMQKEGNRPDVITFAALINAFERGHQWRLALTALDMMQNFGLHPDANIFNSLLDVLWQSGIALAQARALQLWSMANRTGLFRIYISKTSETSSQLQYTALALSGGALCVTLLRWIGEMKSRLAREGVSFLRTSVSLLMYRSKSSSGPYVRSASSQLQEAQGPEGEASAANSLQPSALDPFSSSMLETFSSMLAGASSPFTLSLASSNQNDYEASHIGNLGNPFLMIEAQSSLLAPWLSSIDCSNLLLLAAQGGSIQLRKSHESALNDDMTLAMRSREAFERALRLELSQPINMQSYSPQVMSQRIQVVGTAIKICASLTFGQDAVYDSLLRFDRCLSTLGASFDHFSWPLLLSACILHSGIQADALTRMILAITGGREDQVRMNLSPQTRDLISNIIQHPVEAMVQMERRVVDILGQESLGNFSTLKFVELFLQRIGMDVHLGGEGSSSSIVARLTSDIHVLLTKAACSTAMMSFRPSLVASAALIVARKKHGAVPFWPGALQLMTGYALTDPKLNKETDLSACFACLSSLGDN